MVASKSEFDDDTLHVGEGGGSQGKGSVVAFVVVLLRRGVRLAQE